MYLTVPYLLSGVKGLGVFRVLGFRVEGSGVVMVFRVHLLALSREKGKILVRFDSLIP